MVKTSLAIATLVSSAASAATTITAGTQTGNAKWNSGLSAPTVPTQFSSRTSAYVIPTSLATNVTWNTPTYKTGTGTTAMATATLSTTVTTTASSDCVQCIGGGGVWCSRTFSFVTSGSAYTAAGTTYAASVAALYSTTDESTWYATTASDQGTCCSSPTDMLARVTAVAQSFTINTAASNISVTCPAFTTSVTDSTGGTPTGGVWNANTWESTNTGFTSWWCSNGLYKNVTATSGTPANTTNVVQVMGVNDNQRKELALVGCPNITARCGMDTITKGVYSLTTTTATTVNVLTASGLTITDKCTWVATSYLYAPTFQMNNAAAAKGLATLNWQIHHMEYMTAAGTSFSAATGYLLETAAATTVGTQQDYAGVGFGNYVPRFVMPAAQFATMRTWYGSNTARQLTTSQYGAQSTNWFSPYVNPAGNTLALSTNYAGVDSNQYFGNVANIPVVGYSTSTAVGNIAAGVNYGVNGTGTVFDFRQVRYLPAQSAQTVWAAGSALNTAYTSATTSYATAKTTWNAYVAILKKNAKMDAFAAAFSPPKAPTVPPLPNMPWTPAAYTGYVKQSGSKNALMLGNQAATTFTTTSQPTAGEFWYSVDAAQSIGGWGAWTAQIIKFRSGWAKSFGTIGYSGSSSAQTMSQIWNAQAMCGASFATQGAAYACDSTYSTAGVATTITAGNTAVRFVTVVSLWSVGNTGSASAASQWNTFNDLQLVFTPSAWSNSLQGLTAISQPTAPTAADSLTGVAGASALAASSAAVLAIAALY